MTNHEYLIMFDDGNVLNHNGVRETRFRNALAEFMMHRYGGERDKWIELNRSYIEKFMGEFHQMAADRTNLDFNAYFHHHKIEWGKALLEGYDIVPSTDENLLTLFQEAIQYINPRAASPNEGIVELIDRLSSEDFRLITASGEISEELTYYLQGFGDGVLNKFERLYGPDLINVSKFVPTFFEKIIEECGVPADHAILIDDNPHFLENADELGIKTILCEISKPLGKRSLPSRTFRAETAEKIYEIITTQIVGK